MKFKSLILVGFFLLGFSNLFAQIEKGSKMIGGGLSFVNSYQQTGPSSSLSNSSIGAQMGVFRFSGPRFGYGIDAGAGFGWGRNNNPNTPQDTSLTNLSFSISPSLGFFIPLKSERTYFTLISAYTFYYQISGRTPGKDYVGYSNAFSFAPGVLYFINENVGFSAQLAFASQSNPLPQLSVRCLLPKRK